MELELYSQGRKLDLSNNKFEINLSSFNPLTLEDSTRKYTSSIKLPRSSVNDSVFFAYRNPHLVPRETLNIDVYISGLFIESFGCVIVVNNDGYSINLTPVKQSLSQDKSEMTLSNDKSMPFYLSEGRIIDLYELAKYNYPSLIRRFDISFPIPMITTEIEQLSSSLIGMQVIAEKSVWSEVSGGDVSSSQYIRFENDNLNKHLLYPDEARTIRIDSNNSKVYLEDTDQGSFTPTVTIRFDNDPYSSANLIYEGSTPNTRIYRVPNLSATYSPDKPLRMTITSDTNKQSFRLGEFKPNVYISGSQYIVTGVNAELKSKYDSLKAYAQAFLSYTSIEGSKIIVKPVISNTSIDWSSRFVRLDSIAEAKGAARSKRVAYGNVLFEVFSNDIATRQYDDIQYSIPMSIEKNKPSTISQKKDRQYSYYENYFDSQEYKNKVIALYSNFSECIEYNIDANLSIFDLLDFDSSNKVYISEFNSYFYVLSISGWSTNNGNCKVKLLKLL